LKTTQTVVVYFVKVEMDEQINTPATFKKKPKFDFLHSSSSDITTNEQQQQQQQDGIRSSTNQLSSSSQGIALNCKLRVIV
jgi:hypothetical protein